MATVDTSLYAQFGVRPKSMAEFARERDEAETNRLALLINQEKYSDMQRQRERGNALQSLMSSIPADATPEQRMNTLRTGGFNAEADDLYKATLANRKTQADIAKDEADAQAKQLTMARDRMGIVLQAISSAKDQGSYDQARMFLQAQGFDVSDIPPQFNPAYVQNAGQQALTAMQRIEAGLKEQNLKLGQERAAEAVRHNRATEDNTRRGQNLSYSATVRGQDMTDARAKTTGSPTANVTEGERNASGYALRMDEATKLLDKFEKSGKGSYTTQAIGAIPLVGDALQRAAMSPEQQQYKQAADDWIRAKLRKESGAVIGEQEMQAEYRTYFPIPGDSPEVIRQKREARAVASQAMRNAAGRAAPPSQPSQPKVVDFGSLK